MTDSGGPVASLLGLQRTHGNRFVQRLLRGATLQPSFSGPGSPDGLLSPRGGRCSVTGSFTRVPPAATTRPTVAGSTLSFPFWMVGKFSASIPCSCSCGEYRQYVRGRLIRNGEDVPHALCGANLDPTTYHEDCTIDGGEVYKYGYRSIPFATSVFIYPDQETGCTFVGHDEPSISADSGDTVGLDLDYRGQLIDTCNGDRVLASADWSVAGSARLP
jgi:hypothetical protein